MQGTILPSGTYDMLIHACRAFLRRSGTLLYSVDCTEQTTGDRCEFVIIDGTLFLPFLRASKLKRAGERVWVPDPDVEFSGQARVVLKFKAKYNSTSLISSAPLTTPLPKSSVVVPIHDSARSAALDFGNV